jgi:hypothetical protein
MFEAGQLRINLGAGKVVIDSFDQAAEDELNLCVVAAIIHVSGKAVALIFN